MSTGSMRGAAAIVGVADAASPTGELEPRGRALEAAMIREALDDAGLTLADVDGVCSRGIADRPRRVPRHPPPLLDGDQRPAGRASRSTSSTRPPRSPPGCATSWSASTPRRPAATAGAARRPAGRSARWARPRRRVGDALRPADADGPLRAGRRAGTWPSTARRPSSSPRSRSTPGAWAALNPRARLPRPDHHRRRAGLADAGVAAAPARLLPRHRRRRRVRDDQRRAGPRPAPSRRSTCSAPAPATTTR